MYTSISNFKKEFQNENQTTLKIFKAISNEKLAHKPNENVRSIKRLVWHMTITLGEMMSKAGLKIDCPDEHTEPLDNINDIIHVYEKAAKSVLEQVEKNWSDADLTTELDMYGEKWAKGTILNVLIKHEIHHRGQLTVIMRFSGIQVPGTYGPSKEEWATWNMPPAE